MTKDCGSSYMTSVLLWAAMTTGLVLAILSALKICTAACSETAKYEIFRMDFGWFGVAFFIISTAALALRNRFIWMRWCFSLMLFAGAGAEIHFIWLQKYSIGRWCPLCLWIAAMVLISVCILIYEQIKSTKISGGNMKKTFNFMAIMIVALVFGLIVATIGVKKEAEAAGFNPYLGKLDSPTTVYIVSDWFCPSCRNIEPEIERIFPELARQVRIAFIDYPIHPETSNFTPYNLQFLLHEKNKYIPLRRALNLLSQKVKSPTNEQVQEAIASTGVKLQQLNFMDVMTGVKLNESIYRGYGVNATPTIVVVNEKTKKKTLLVGDKNINRQTINAAIAGVEK